MPAHEKSVVEQRQRYSPIQFNKVLIVGLGQLGLPVARYVKERGFDTFGYDISTKAMERAEKIAGIKKASTFSDFDIYILCVSTHKPDDMFSPQIDGLLSITDRISREAKNGALVSIESTIPKGTSTKTFELLNHRLHVVHAPHRWYALEEKEHGVNQLRVIGGVCNCCLRLGVQFYDGNSASNDEKGVEHSSFSSLSSNSSLKSLGIPMHPVTEIEIAEITKVIENAHRYLQIAFAEELYLYCQANNINFPELRDALNTKWNVNILEPREGIGGHCLPKDTKMFLRSSKAIRSKILTASMEVDQHYRRYRQTRGWNNNPGQSTHLRTEVIGEEFLSLPSSLSQINSEEDTQETI
ncbi:MAG TPA: NAD(P)-binding domain-containing protein [Candidatus Nitrosopolaris sp.]|nr:NAD(P)-binding domain-containing protein [Candidatus Nitrosopolaris sp.]